MINAYIMQMFAPLNFLGTYWRFIRQSMVDVEQIFELLEVKEHIHEAEEPEESNITAGQIEFKNVSFTYDKKLPEEQRRIILDNVSFKVPAGQSVALVGSTGSGKSTIMRLLYRFYDIDEGEIYVDGHNIRYLAIKDLRSQIAIVPQDCVLFNDTLRYNIGYGGVRNDEMKKLLDDPDAKDALTERITPMAKRAQIHQFVQLKAKKYEELVGERGLKLSGGEKQRVAIARALLKKTAIMCFDEATSALDTETEREIQNAINEVSKGSTTVIIAHRLSTVKDCDKIIVLKHGVIVEEGPHDELVSIPNGHYRTLWEKQSDQAAREMAEKERRDREAAEYEEALQSRMQMRRSLSKKLRRGESDDEESKDMEKKGYFPPSINADSKKDQ